MARFWFVAAMVLFPTTGLHAAPPHPWTIRVEGGFSRIHLDDRGKGGALRVARDIGAARAGSLEVGLMSGPSYVALDLGLEARLCRACRLTPFLGIGVGALGEEDYAGWLARVTGGVAAPLGSRVILRASAQFPTAASAVHTCSRSAWVTASVITVRRVARMDRRPARARRAWERPRRR